MSFLAFDGDTLVSTKYPLYEVSFFAGVARIAQFWKYHLHGTMGRPIIVKNGVWGK